MEVAHSSVSSSTSSFPERSTLTRRDRIVLGAIAEAMFSQDGEVEAARVETHLDEVDAFISAASRPVRFGLRVALLIVRIAPLLLFFSRSAPGAASFRTIERLPIDERVEILERLERSSITNLSLAFIGWRTVITMVFYEHPAELRSLGYTTSERQVYKRRLALAPVATVPMAEESGVRLKNPDSLSGETIETVETVETVEENKVA